MNSVRLHNLLEAGFRWGALLTLCVAPTQWTLIQNPRLGPADLLLALTAGVWGLDILLTRDWRRVWAARPHWTHLVFTLCVGAAVFAAADRKEALKELVQVIEYFIVGAIMFAAFLRTKRPDCPDVLPLGGSCSPATLALTALGVVTAAVLALAAVQYVWPGHGAVGLFAEKKTLDIIVNVLGGPESPLLVGGSFGNRNVLGGFLALALPLCAAGAMGCARSRLSRVGCAALVLAGLALNLSGASYGAIVLVIAAMAAARGARWFIPVAAMLVLWQAVVLPRLPRENDLCHYESVALYEDTGQMARRYPDWQAAASMILTHPWLGVGPGNYQKQVGQYYGHVPNATGPAEPDIQNLYLVLGASCGLPGLLAFLAMLSTAVGASVKSNRLGVAGALIAFAATAVWHPLLVRGIGLPLVFVLVLSRHLAQEKAIDGSHPL